MKPRWIALSIGMVLMIGGAAFAQGRQGGPDVAVQKEAMKRLSFLLGTWHGEAEVTTGPGAAKKVLQTEEIQMRLDGLVMVLEGTGTLADTGVVAFRAFATIAFDEATKTYRFRAYNDGNYVDTELELLDGGFEWGFTAGPAKITNTMKLDAAGQWVETTDVVINGAPPRRTMEMRVRK